MVEVEISEEEVLEEERRFSEEEIEKMLDGFMAKHSMVYDRLAEI